LAQAFSQSIRVRCLAICINSVTMAQPGAAVKSVQVKVVSDIM